MRQAAIREVLRQALVSGRWRPGDRLPPRLRLVEELDTTSSTLQSALDELIAEGQIVARGSQGTYVAELPPYLNRFGLMFPSAVGEHGDMNRQWQALSLAAGLPRSDGCRIDIFYGQHRRFASTSFDRLIEDCSRQLIAGLILVAPTTMIADTPLAACPIPRVYVTSGPPPPGDAVLGFDHASFRRLAITSLVRRGCSRIAVILGAGYFAGSGAVQAWEDDLTAAGLHTRPSWMLGCDIEYPRSAVPVVRLLFSRPEDRPDGVVVVDDHLLEPTGAGLQAEGLEAGRDVHLVSHANFPLPAGCDVVAERIGFDAARVIDAAIGFCAARRRGEHALGLKLQIPAEAEVDVAG